MRQAFSLVELSIVLVILGLLTGGILTGQALIRAAELRSVTTEFQRYQTAVQTFRDKYRALPGDMRDATRFWGRQTSDAWCTSSSGASVSASGVCDGNGDGNIDAAGAANQSTESFQLWRQLANAGLVEGSFSGLAGPGNVLDAVLGSNVPQSKISNAGFNIRNLGTAGDGNMYALNYANAAVFGSDSATLDTVNAIIRPEEAWNIDVKVDDGKPAQGMVIARFWNDLCAAADDGTHANTDLIASYKLSDTSARCALYFRQLF